MATFRLEVPITRFFSYDSQDPDHVYTMCMPWGRIGTLGASLNTPSAAFAGGTVVRLPDAATNSAADSATVIADPTTGATAVVEFDNVCFSLKVVLDDTNQPTDTVDTVIVSFNVFVAVDVPAAGDGIRIETAVNVPIPEGSTEGQGNGTISINGPRHVTQTPDQTLISTSAYPPGSDFSAHLADLQSTATNLTIQISILF
jgi:hypothetical protein